MSRTRFTLIDRGPKYTALAVETSILGELPDTIYGQPILSQRPITMEEIRKQRIRIYTAEEHADNKRRGQERAAELEWRSGVRTGVVRWFDRVSGEGMALVNGRLLPIYACNIPGRKTWYPTTACMYYEPGTVIECKIHGGIMSPLLVSMTPGILDEEKWDQLKHQNLAFRCNEAGEAVTGLFATGDEK